MSTVPLTTALKLIRYNPQLDTEAAAILQKTIEELERLYKVEAEYNASKEQPAPDPADWTAANRMVRQQ